MLRETLRMARYARCITHDTLREKKIFFLNFFFFLLLEFFSYIFILLIFFSLAEFNCSNIDKVSMGGS